MRMNLPRKRLLLAAAFIAATIASAPVLAAKKSPSSDDMFDLDAMTDQLDQLDKLDFQSAIDKATSCTRMRDFPCAEAELTKAAKSANGGKDKKLLLAGRQSLANERQALANEIRRAEEARRRAEEERQAQIRREEEAEREREERRRREAEEDDSSYSASNDIGMYILQKGQENAAILSNLNRQTTAAYAETNRRLAAQAAERKRAREEQEERAAERRREARRERERAQRVADARERDDAAARDRRAAEESRAQQRQDEERRNQAARGELERKRVASVEEARRQAEAASSAGATRSRQPHQPYADPDPYENHRNGWGGEHSAGWGQTREAACKESKNKSQEEIARLSTYWRFDAISPCVCSVNVGADRSHLDAMAETGEPDHWKCWQYDKRTQIRDMGNRSK